MTTPAPQAPAHRALTPPRGPAVWRAIYAHAVAHKAFLVGSLAVYAMAVAVGVGALWPPLQDAFDSIAADLPAGLDSLLGGLSIATPTGWLHAELLSIMGPGFLIAAALLSATSATAGEEEGGTLGLVLATGATRTTFLAAKAAATLTHVLIAAAGMFAGMVLANPIGNLGIPAVDLLAATLNMTLLALVAGAIALTLGVITARTRLTLAITGGLLAASFVSANFLGIKESLVGFSKINLWYPYSANPVLAGGIDWGYIAILAGLALGIGAVAFAVFPRRRNLRG